MSRLNVRLGPVELSSPLIAAAGTVGSVVEFSDSIDFSHYGAAVAKSIAPEPWPGRNAPRIAPVDTGMLNGIGIQNPGVAAWIDEVEPHLSSLSSPVWASIVAHDVEGFGEVAASLDATTVPAIEINLSCPNLDGVPFALEAAVSGEIVERVRAATSKPIGAKLSADAQPVVEVAGAVAEAGADWVVMGNTVMGAAINVDTRRPALSGLIGGYSGSPIRPIMIKSVIDIARSLPDLPIVGCGGVSTADHVIEYVLAGASAVGIGSAHFRSPRVAARILKDLRGYLRKHNVATLSELTGAYEPWN
jgi:dihydroorotate dehydrogenase (NAD+) catalytic subunit